MLSATLLALSDRFAGQLPATTFAALREHFAARTSGRRALAAAGKSHTAALEQLRALRLEVDQWSVKEIGWKTVEDGLVVSPEKVGHPGDGRVVAEG